ncbi:TPA: cell surface protein, partial [Streptococcus pyogenes]
MKKHLKTVALTLTTVSVVTHNQEVFSLVKEPILKQTQASSSISGADYAESSGKSKLKINETSGPVDDTVTDLFSDKRTTPEKIQDNLAKGPREQELKAVTENTESEKQINSGSQLEQSKESLSLNKRVPSTSNWEICDFITKGNTLVGLSKSGVEKLSQTDHLVLPSQAADGTQLIQVASFA